MAPRAHVLREILPHDAMNLGWLVLSTTDPLQTYFQTSDPLMPVIEHEFDNLADSRSQQYSTGFGGFISGVLKTGLRLERGVSVNIDAASFYISRLPNADEWFEKAVVSEKLRKWFEARIERHGWRLHVYLVVGLHVAKNVRLSVTRTNGFNIPIELMVPVLALLGDPGILGAILGNPGASMDYSKLEQSSTSFETRDIIYAVQYRQVKINWLTGKDKLYLSSKTCWKITATDAGVEDEEEEEEVAEVVLAEQDYDDHDDGHFDVAFEVSDTGERFLVKSNEL